MGTVFTENQNEMHKGVYPPGRIELLEAVPGKLLRYRMELPGAAAYFGGMDSEELVFEVRPHCSGELSTSTVTMRSTWRTTWIALPLLPFVPLALPVWHTRCMFFFFVFHMQLSCRCIEIDKLQGSRLRQFVRQNNRPTRMEGVLRTLHRLHMPVPSDVPTEP